MITQYYPILVSFFHGDYKEWKPCKHLCSVHNNILYDTLEECKAECARLNKNL